MHERRHEPCSNFLTGRSAQNSQGFHACWVFALYVLKKKYKLSAPVTPRQSALLRTLWTLVRVPQMLNSCLFAGMAFARVIVLNIRNPNGVSCPGCSPRLFFQAAGLRYSVQKWNARPGASTSVLLPISHLFIGLLSQRDCSSIVIGRANSSEFKIF